MEPYRLTLEFSRKNKVDDKYAFKMQAQIYHRRFAGGAYSAAELPWDDDFIAAIEQLRAQKRDPEVIQRLGNELRKFLGETGWANEEDALRAAVDEERRVVITIRSAAAELYAVPWELVTLGQTMRHIGWLPNVLVQYEWVDEQPNKSAPEKPSLRPEGGRILFAFSAAAGDVPHRRHLEAIEDACEEAHHDFDADRDVLSGASLGALRKALEDASSGKDKPIAVLHVLCHGGPVGTAFGLMLDADDGGDGGVDPAALADLLAPHAGMVRLVVIAACDSGNIGPLGNHMGSVAQAIHRAGVAAVVASRYPFSKKGSNEFAEAFYRALLVEPCSVESAFLAARRRLAEVDTGRVDWASVQLYAREADGFDTRPIVVRPYQGLLPLGPAQNRFFFGREKEAQEIVSDLGALVKAEQPRFLVVQGWSGTGKSSMVMAGAVPRLTKPADPSAGEPGEPGWSPGYACIKMKPGGDPMRSLYRALDQDERRPLLLVVDQLEEIFTHASEEERNKFARELWRLARDPQSGVSVIVTIRSDFIGRCGEILLDDKATRLDAIANDDAFSMRVSQLSREQLRETIEKPAAKVGLQVPRALVNTILNDIGQSLGALPLVAHTMNLLWQGRRGRELSLETYDELGKVTGALHQHADKLIDNLGEQGTKMAERLFVGLVGRDADHDGAAPGDTRRRLKVKEVRDEVCQQHTEKEACFDEMLASLDTGRLLVIEGEGDAKTVEVAHEALIRGWKTLDRWLEQYGDMLRRKKELDRWLQMHRDVKTLLNERQIETAAAFKEDYPQAFSRDAEVLLATSRAKIKAARTRERVALVSSIVAAMLMSGLGVWAFSERSKAVEQRRVAIERRQEADAARDAAQTATRMAVARELLARGQGAAASKVLLEVAEPEKVHGWIELANDVLILGMERTTLRHDGNVVSAAWSPDGKRIVTASTDKAVRVWNADGTGTPITIDTCDAPTSATWSPDGKRLLFVDGTTARIWSPDCVGVPVDLAQPSANDAEWSPDGKRIVAVSGTDVVARVWNDDGTGTPLALKHGDNGIRFVAWSPDSRRLLTLTNNNGSNASIWDIDEGGGTPVAAEIMVPYGGIESAAWSPDGKRIVAITSNTNLWVVNRDGTGSALNLDGHGAAVQSVAWSPDGKRIVTASRDDTARIWDASGKESPVVLGGHGDDVMFAAWSPDGKRVVTASHDKLARIWNADSRSTPITLEGHELGVTSAAWSPSGDRVLTVSQDQTVRVWSAAGSDYPIVLEGHEATSFSEVDPANPYSDAILSAEWTPDGKRIVTTSNDETAWAWGGDGRGPAVELEGCKAKSRDRIWSPDKSHCVLAADFDTARLQRADSKDEAVTLQQPEELVDPFVAWSPDSARVAIAVRRKEKEHALVRIWTVGGRGEPVTIEAPADVVKLAWSPDHRNILAIADDTAWVIRVDGKSEPIALHGHAGQILSAVWSPDGKRVVTWSLDKTARVWNADGTGASVVLEGHESAIQVALWSHEGGQVALLTGDGLVRLWDAAGKGTAIVLNSYQYPAKSITWSPRGKRIVTTADDKIARIWNTDGDRDTVALKAHSAPLMSAAWSPDGTRVITASKDNTARIWLVTVPALQEALRNATTYCLTPEQRQRFLLESEVDAKSRYEACERSYHRSPPGPRVGCAKPPK